MFKYDTRRHDCSMKVTIHAVPQDLVCCCSRCVGRLCRRSESNDRFVWGVVGCKDASCGTATWKHENMRIIRRAGRLNFYDTPLSRPRTSTCMMKTIAQANDGKGGST